MSLPFSPDISQKDLILTAISIMGGAALPFVFQWMRSILSSLRGPFAGLWEGRIYGGTGRNVTRADVMVLRQHGEQISGKVGRVFPPAQQARRWQVKGLTRRNVFYAVFWILDPADESEGCWLLTQESVYRLDGYYLKTESDTQSAAESIPTRTLPPYEDVSIQPATEGFRR